MNEIDWLWWMLGAAWVLLVLSAILTAVTIAMVLEARRHLRRATRYPLLFLPAAGRERDQAGRITRERI